LRGNASPGLANLGSDLINRLKRDKREWPDISLGKVVPTSEKLAELEMCALKYSISSAESTG
jgi:hypothetical protein